EIAPRYFETLRIPLVVGRDFDDCDTLTSPPVAIISETLARRLWPAAASEAIGATVVVGKVPRTVVGVAGDVLLSSRAETLAPYTYVPFWQNAGSVDARLCVRVNGDPAAALPAL